ncbi:M18 family aminopeptidase [Deltaproteobacteria bacterium TL4]
MKKKKALTTVTRLMEFLYQSPTPFHAVENVITMLKSKGFEEQKEENVWQVTPGGLYYAVRSDASIIAWIQGQKTPAQSGFKILGAHTDSPHLRIKPKAAMAQHQYCQLGVEVYGGVLLSSWADRDLSLAGQVFVKNSGSGLDKHLIKMTHPVLRIPLLAIHLEPDVNTKGLILDKQKHLPPILGLTPVGESSDSEPLLTLLSQTLGVEAERILSHELSLYDLQKPELLGMNQEFISGSRIDNLFCCFCAMEALLAQVESQSESTCVVACFDNEEIGSVTTQGARSSFLKNMIRRLSNQTNELQAFERALARSFFVSGDMAHAVHPNYPEKHDPQHFPHINQGPVIKTNAQGRYATSGNSSALFELICQELEIPVQKFVNRTDLSCGSTIGPLIAGALGIPTVDVGAAMLSMHSIREMCGSQDPDYLIQAFKGVFQHHFKIQA